jgi:methionyl-tRNA synthetase
MEEIIDINEFAKLDLRIGKIENAERVEAEEYTPESLIGKLVPILANLKPVKLMGVESQGMILAVDVNGKPILLHPDREVPAGSGIR